MTDKSNKKIWWKEASWWAVIFSGIAAVATCLMTYTAVVSLAPIVENVKLRNENAELVMNKNQMEVSITSTKQLIEDIKHHRDILEKDVCDLRIKIKNYIIQIVISNAKLKTPVYDGSMLSLMNIDKFVKYERIGGEITNGMELIEEEFNSEGISFFHKKDRDEILEDIRSFAKDHSGVFQKRIFLQVKFDLAQLVIINKARAEFHRSLEELWRSYLNKSGNKDSSNISFKPR